MPTLVTHCISNFILVLRSVASLVWVTRSMIPVALFTRSAIIITVMASESVCCFSAGSISNRVYDTQKKEAIKIASKQTLQIMLPYGNHRRPSLILRTSTFKNVFPLRGTRDKIKF